MIVDLPHVVITELSLIYINLEIFELLIDLRVA